MSQPLCFKSVTRFILIGCVLPIFTITSNDKEKQKKRYTFFVVVHGVFFSFSFGAAANVVFVAVRDDLVLKHSNNKTKITPKTDKQNVQNEICLPKKCR